MRIETFQGSENHRQNATDVTIVIDVIRAFTTSEVAFSKGVSKILMVKDTQEAFELREQNSELLLMGEIDARPITGFDFDNSPQRLNKSSIDIKGKVLVQRTTNGVKAVVNNFNANHTFVTGFSNAYVTAKYIKEYIMPSSVCIIASHPSSDEDMACADYLQAILNDYQVDPQTITQRIRDSAAAQKFYLGNDIFLAEDIALSTAEKPDNQFVMRVSLEENTLIMKKVSI